MAALKPLIAALARAHGFDLAGIASARASAPLADQLNTFIAEGRHGDMDWLAATADRRAAPQALWPQARSLIMLAMNYAPPDDPLPELAQRASGYISVYARNRDYHDVIKGKLKQMAGQLAARGGCAVKVFVDTAPLMEKPAAQRAGLGWQGKHTNLVSRDFGSWLFLGAILTDAEIEQDEAEGNHCGTCRACLDICPTHAFPAPYQLDARRCISYLTIEHKGHIDAEFRVALGNRIYGCDDCLAVCPWNKFAQASRETKLQARADLTSPRLAELAGLDDTAFRSLFAGSPVKRIGRDRFLRNVLIAIANSGDPTLTDAVRSALDDASPLVRAMAVWALSRLVAAVEIAALARLRMPGESDAAVLDEWNAAMAQQQVRA